MTDAELAAAITGALREMRTHFDRGDIDAALDHGTLMLQQLLGVDRAFVLLISEDHQYVTVIHASGGVSPEFLGQKSEFAKLPNLTMEVLRSGRQVILEDAGAFSLDRAASDASGVGATIVMPLYAHNRVVGALFVDTHKKGRWHEAAVNACRRIASAMSRCLNEVHSIDAPPLPKAASAAASREQHAHALSAIKNRLKMGMPNGTIKEVIERELPTVFNGKVVLHVGDAGDLIVAEAARGRAMLKRQEGMQMRVLLPLVTDQRRLGVIDVVLPAKSNFTVLDVNTLEAVGNYATRALANASDAPRSA